MLTVSQPNLSHFRSLKIHIQRFRTKCNWFIDGLCGSGIVRRYVRSRECVLRSCRQQTNFDFLSFFLEFYFTHLYGLA